MSTIYKLKPQFQNLLRPLVKQLYRIGVTANQVTLFAMFVSIFLAFYLYMHSLEQTSSWILLLLPIWMLIRMALNAIDGMLAKEFAQQSQLGAFYNELSDVISDTALYLCFIGFSFIQSELLLIIVFLAILSEYTGVMAPLIGKERRYDGPMGKSDRAFCFGLLTTIIFVFPIMSDHSEYLIYLCNGLLFMMGLLLVVTIYNRIKNSITTAI
ncbi:MAG: CDP-alcohol phosphatidyltransferase family protein [Candidatus Acinetobacter avistercoris]|uniref:CDP-alcohol phosphatidyltransferase family protein n=1 Tax=Acinetobacter sp. KS-LM10 TaxID=3120518 RepID=UPI001F8EA2B7|nr:CDP-alcohol phosphatidyltransferase family protein [Candidatus Acinetobacter avistercoris]